MPQGGLVPGSPTKLLSPNENNPQYNKEKENQLLSSYYENNQEVSRLREVELLSRFEKIAGTQKNIFKVLQYVYENGCTFGKDLEKGLNLNLGTAHRIIDKLTEAGFIEPLTKTFIPAKHGKKTTIYGLINVTQKEIQRAISRDLKYSSKSLKYVDIIYQRTLPDIERDGIQMHKIMKLAKRYGNNNGFHYTDLARFVANKHQMAGVKVWQNS